MIVVGSAAVDISAQVTAPTAGDIALSTSPGAVSITLGGVGRNISEAAHRILTFHSPQLSDATMLVSLIGDDGFGRVLLDEMRNISMRTDGLTQKSGVRSAVCNMMLDSAGNLIDGIADMDIVRSLDGETVRDLRVTDPYATNILSGSANHKESQAQNRSFGRQSAPRHPQNLGRILQRE